MRYSSGYEGNTELEIYLKENLTYDPDTGKLWWTKRGGNRRNINKPVGTLHSSGYLIFTASLNQKDYSLRVHRVIYFLKTGNWPQRFIDHKDGNRSNNKWENIREANDKQNSHNSRKPVTNKSGYKGVSWQKDKNKWVVRMKINDSHKFFGYFSCPTKAALKYDEVAKRYHGEYARLNFK